MNIVLDDGASHVPSPAEYLAQRMEMDDAHDKTQKTWLSWSSGKDSAWALHVLRHSDEYEVTGLFTTVNGAFNRVAMHAVRIELLKRQAAAVGLPINLIKIPHPCSNESYAIRDGEFRRACPQ